LLADATTITSAIMIVQHGAWSYPLAVIPAKAGIHVQETNFLIQLFTCFYPHGSRPSPG
jgi:hypothetical protein